MYPCRILIAVSVAMAVCVFAPGSVRAAETSGGVNWLDSRGYEKPAFYPITVPDETETCAAGRCWYVDLSAGGGTACTSSSPCLMSGLAGKSGMAGGPAYVYVKSTSGSGNWMDVGSVYGSPSTPIVVKHWTENVINLATNNLQLDSQHDIVWDGGPNLGFKATHTGSSDTSFFVHVRGADNLTFARIQANGANGVNAGIFDLASYSSVDGFKLINSEFYDFYNTSAQAAAVYFGPGGTNTIITNTEIRGNIFRNFACEVLEVNPHGGYADNVVISGNVFNHAGMGCCPQGWNCRPPITMGGMDGGDTTNYSVSNNLIWDTGAGCMFARSSGPGYFENNVCYDYDNPTTGGAPNPEGIEVSGTLTVRNNIIYDPQGTNPFSSLPTTATHNLCASGKSCGASSRVWSVNSVLSTDENTANFLKIGSSSEALDHGATLGDILTDYLGLSRPQGSAYDIGAFELVSDDTTPPSAPTGLAVQ